QNERIGAERDRVGEVARGQRRPLRGRGRNLPLGGECGCQQEYRARPRAAASVLEPGAHPRDDARAGSAWLGLLARGPQLPATAPSRHRPPITDARRTMPDDRMHDDATAMIETRGLTRTFGKTTAVQDLDLHVRAGEIYGFLGPNGAGKTTTIRMFCGLLRPSRGSIRIAGIDLETDAPAARHLFG